MAGGSCGSCRVTRRYSWISKVRTTKHWPGSGARIVAEELDDPAKAADETPVTGIEARQVPVLPQQRLERHRGGRRLPPAKQHDFQRAVQRADDFGRGRLAGAGRPRIDAGGDRAESLPGQLAAQLVAPRPAAWRPGDDQVPVAVPGVRRRGIDPPIGAFEASPPLRRQPVEAAPPGLAAGKPSVPGEPIDAGAHQPLVESERRQQANQPRQPDGAAVRGQRVAPDGHDQRLGPRRRRIQLAPDPARDRRMRPAFHRRRHPTPSDTEIAIIIAKVYRFNSPAASTGSDAARRTGDVRADGRHRRQEAPFASRR